MTDQEIQQIQYLVNRITEAIEGNDRQKLAAVYEIAISAPSFCPRPPLSMKRANATKLRKAVCSYCPSKVRPADMKRHVELCKGQLRSYNSQLKAILKDEGADQPSEPTERISVHDLDSTL